MCKNRFPIKDIQFHEEGIREAARGGCTRDEAVAIAWHTTAIMYLECGAAYELPGPAAVVPKVSFSGGGMTEGVEALLIEDYLLPATDSHGLTYFQPVLKEAASKAG